MSCCGNKPPDPKEDRELRLMVTVLRARRNKLKGGDGFTHAGTLIGAYKRTISRMEELIALVEGAPEEEPTQGERTPNADCYGEYGQSVPGCQCRKIFAQIKR
jgi:hypothetical protein